MEFPATIAAYNQIHDRVTLFFPLNMRVYFFYRDALNPRDEEAKTLLQRIVDKVGEKNGKTTAIPLTMEEWKTLFMAWERLPENRK